MAKHYRKFNVDRFLDKFQGQETLLRNFVSRWDGRLDLDIPSLDVHVFKDFLSTWDGNGTDEMVEALHRAYDLCSERGHEDLMAACKDFPGNNPDPEGELPVECLSLKILTESEDAFNFAYDRYSLWKAERFTIYRSKEAIPIPDMDAAAKRFHTKLAEEFKDHKSSDRVLVRHYQEGNYTNFIVYHEKRTKAELTFKGTKTKPEVSPTILRPAQQDFISYNNKTGQIEIEAGFEKEEAALRKCFAECCLGNKNIFEGKEASNRINLQEIAEEDFDMSVDEGHSAALMELHFNLKQKHGPFFSVRSKDILETLDLNYMRKRLKGAEIKKAVFKITFPDDGRGKRIELSDTNKIKFKRATHAEDIFRYLKKWKVINE